MGYGKGKGKGKGTKKGNKVCAPMVVIALSLLLSLPLLRSDGW